MRYVSVDPHLTHFYKVVESIIKYVFYDTFDFVPKNV